jgi:uncharacterized protein YcaQ
MWDRGGIHKVFGFDYVWEVYKPAERRRWGWYVLPVVQRDRFVGRIEGVREERRGGETVWRVDRWWWEEGVDRHGRGAPVRQLEADLESAAARFSAFLGASRCVVRGGVPKRVAEILRSGAAQVGRSGRTA